ncbi:hypothetical protein MaudMau93_007316 [Microsporum audouinii]
MLTREGTSRCLRNAVSVFHVVEKELAWRRERGLAPGFEALRACKPIVACGADRALDSEPVDAGYFHGFDGLGNVHTKPASYNQWIHADEQCPHLSAEESYEALFAPGSADGTAASVRELEAAGEKGGDRLYTPSRELAHREILRLLRENDAGTITIVAVGPLTNLALAAAEDLDAFLRAKEVVIMGGAIDEPGNVRPPSHHYYTTITTSLHHYITTSLHHYITTSLHHYITTSLHHYITHHYITTSLHHYHYYTISIHHLHIGVLTGNAVCGVQRVCRPRGGGTGACPDVEPAATELCGLADAAVPARTPGPAADAEDGAAGPDARAQLHALCVPRGDTATAIRWLAGGGAGVDCGGAHVRHDPGAASGAAGEGGGGGGGGDEPARPGVRVVRADGGGVAVERAGRQGRDAGAVDAGDDGGGQAGQGRDRRSRSRSRGPGRRPRLVEGRGKPGGRAGRGTRLTKRGSPVAVREVEVGGSSGGGRRVRVRG